MNIAKKREITEETVMRHEIRNILGMVIDGQGQVVLCSGGP